MAITALSASHANGGIRADFRDSLEANNSFFDLAKESSEDEQSRYACGYGGIKFVFEFEPEIQQHLAAVCDGDVIGPIKCIGQHHLIYVDRFFFLPY